MFNTSPATAPKNKKFKHQKIEPDNWKYNVFCESFCRYEITYEITANKPKA